MSYSGYLWDSGPRALALKTPLTRDEISVPSFYICFLYQHITCLRLFHRKYWSHWNLAHFVDGIERTWGLLLLSFPFLLYVDMLKKYLANPQLLNGTANKAIFFVDLNFEVSLKHLLLSCEFPLKNNFFLNTSWLTNPSNLVFSLQVYPKAFSNYSKLRKKIRNQLYPLTFPSTFFLHKSLPKWRLHYFMSIILYRLDSQSSWSILKAIWRV